MTEQDQKEKPVRPNSSPPGPKPETVKIEGDWGDALKKALAKKKPPGGWPKPPKKG